MRDARDAVGNPQLAHLLHDVTSRFGERRREAIRDVPEWEALRERARQIKAHTLANLDRYLVQFETAVARHGGTVHWASTPDEACQVVLDVARRHGVSRVVKSKSMVSEEIGLNDRLAAHGISAVEGDLGEYLIQLAGEHPSHIIAPAIHKSRAQIGRLLEQTIGLPFTEDVDAFTAEVRNRLRPEFRGAALGITGANFAVAETGTLVIVENEGNARLTTSVPRVHVAVIGIEKVVPRVEDLEPLLALLPRSGTGQAMTAYVSLITGPRRRGELDGPDELHVVLLDNGRTTMLGDAELREALRCIRCGACLNVCPVYQTIGGHAYGGVYAGPIGAIVSSSIQPTTTAADLPFASTLCGACAEVCPVKIPIPHLLLHLRERSMAGAMPGERPTWRRLQRLMLRAWAAAMKSPSRYALASRLLRITLRPRAQGGWIARLPRPLAQWTAFRDFPEPAARTFRQMYESTTKDTKGTKDANRPNGPKVATNRGHEDG